MSNTRAWRAKPRTPKPNSRQKRNGLYLDAHPVCQICTVQPAAEAHHRLPKGHLLRNQWEYMEALCVGCHVSTHKSPRLTVRISLAKTR